MCEDGHYLDPLDIARLNKRDGEGDIFPYDKWQLIMRSDDVEPPHFHIISEDWNTIFGTESGDLIKIICEGDNQAFSIHNCKTTWRKTLYCPFADRYNSLSNNL